MKIIKINSTLKIITMNSAVLRCVDEIKFVGDPTWVSYEKIRIKFQVCFLLRLGSFQNRQGTM